MIFYRKWCGTRRIESLSWLLMPWSWGIRASVATMPTNTWYAYKCFHLLLGWHIKTENKWPPFSRRYFQKHFLEWKLWISIKIPLKFVPKGPLYNIPALVLITAWRRQGDKPLSEPIMIILLTRICVTRPQWVKYSPHDRLQQLPLRLLVWRHFRFSEDIFAFNFLFIIM